MAKPTIKDAIYIQNDIKNQRKFPHGISQAKQSISESLIPIQFPQKFQRAFDTYADNLKASVKNKVNRPEAQMVFDAKMLIEYLKKFNSVVVTVGQDVDSNFKIAFQGMKISARGTVTLDNEGVLTNYDDRESTPTFPLNGVPTP